MTRICFPLVRYTLNTPIPLRDRPRLKNRAWTENRAESGNSLTANGSSKDSSTSRGVKEPSHSEGALFQSNSILGRIVNQTPMQCNDNVNTRGAFTCQMNNQLKKQNGHRACRWPLTVLEITMLPTITARITIMIGSRSEVIAETALSTSSS